jgi:diaminopimelate decarboxylase
MRPDNFIYNEGRLFLENTSIETVIQEIPTPFFLYSNATIEASCEAYTSNIDSSDLVCYSVKANNNLNILKILVKKGLGFDVVSEGELKKVIKAGADPKRIVFSGVGKTFSELKLAADLGIYSINVESAFELEKIIKLETKPRISFRINPDMEGDTHPYIETGKADCKFGMSEEDALLLAKKFSNKDINLVGLTAHIGSQITDTNLYLDLLKKLQSLAGEMENLGHPIDHLDIGGGLAIDYEMQTCFDPSELVKKIKKETGKYDLLLEPGRSIIAQAGALVTEVIGIKENGQRKFIVVNAGMNDLMRPSLYNARHKIENISANEDGETYSIVGPVCETADSFGDDFVISAKEGDNLIIYSAGAYGSSMGSNYNLRLRPSEILVSGAEFSTIRRAESFEDTLKLEDF